MKKYLSVKKGKILFLSRQYNTLSLDFSLLMDSLLQRNWELHFIAITQRVEKSFISIFRYSIASLRSMYHLATSEVCILDTYWPVASLLEHRKTLTIIQMWHASGKIKQSGYQTLGKAYGRERKLAEAMKMHRGYDVVVAGGRAMNDSYCKSFGVREDQLLNYGLPRLDYIYSNRVSKREEIQRLHPECDGKILVLYAPTFRPGTVLRCNEIAACFGGNEYLFIVRAHPNQPLDYKDQGTDRFRGIPTIDLLCACDYLITDYSAITVEAAVAGSNTLFYLYDYEEYKTNNGLNIDLPELVPSCCFYRPEDLEYTIRTGIYDRNAIQALYDQFLPDCLGESTEMLTDFVMDCLARGKAEAIRMASFAEAATAESF